MSPNFEQHVDDVFRFALSLTTDRHLAEDLTQDCFLRAHRRSKQLENEASAKSWLFKITINLWRDYQKKRHYPTINPHDVVIPTKSSPDSDTIQREKCDQILSLIKLLPAQQRTVLFLSAVEQLSITQIASLVEISENSVKANLCLARKTMRQKLTFQNESPHTKPLI